MTSLNGFDWLLIAVLAVSTAGAFRRGLIRELFALGGLVAGILLASWYYAPAAVWINRIFAMGELANVAAFLVVAVGVMVLSAILGKILQKTASAIGLGFLDRLGGAGFGLIRGCLLGVAIMMTIAAFMPSSGWVQKSRLASYFLRGAHAVSFVVPHDFQSLIRKGAEELKHTPPSWIKPGS